MIYPYIYVCIYIYIYIYTPRVERRDLLHSRHDVNLEENRSYFVRRAESLYMETKKYGQFEFHEVSKISKLISLRIRLIFNSGNKY